MKKTVLITGATSGIGGDQGSHPQVRCERCRCLPQGNGHVINIGSVAGDEARADKVYKGITPLTGADIADVAFYAASAPEHVQIAEVLILATHHASGSVVYRKD